MSLETDQNFRKLLNLVKKGTGETREVETDFSISQASGDALSGTHISERLGRMKGQKTSRKCKLSGHTL